MGSKSRYIAEFNITGNDIVNGSLTIADLGTLYTDNIAESSNLYFTNARARSSLVQGAGITFTPANGLISANVTSLAGLATQTYVDNAVAGLVASAPAALDTLNELAAALNDDADFSNTIVTLISTKANASALSSLTTSNVSEGTNLYFTNTRARTALTVTGSGTYDNTTGIITITGGVESVNGHTGNVTIGYALLVNRFTYTISSNTSIISGADDNADVLYLGSPDAVSVYVNGILLTPVADYTAYASNITFSSNVLPGSTVFIQEGLARLSNVINSGSTLKYSYTATNNQTVFTGTDDTGKTLSLTDPANVHVFLNGILLTAGNDYVAAAANIVLTVGAPIDSTITIIDNMVTVLTNAVTSVNDLTGTVTLTTANIAESGNLYFTNTRARQAISVTGSGSYDNATGIITITGGVQSVNESNGNVVLTTANIAESGNLYFTNTRARQSISVAGAGSYDNATGVITITGGVTSVNDQTGAVVLTTSNIAQGSNLYYSNVLVQSYFDAERPNIFSASLALTRYQYTASNNQTIFTGPDNFGQSLYMLRPDRCLVYLNGILLALNDDYSAYNTNVTLSYGASANAIINIMVGGVADTEPSYIASTRYQYSITSNTLVLSGSDDNAQTLSLTYPDRIHVFLNGILLLPTTDYAAYASNITFTSNVLANSTVVIVDNLAQVVNSPLILSKSSSWFFN